MLVALKLAKLPNDVIELVLPNSVALFLPFSYGNHGAAFGESEAHEPSPKRVSTTTFAGYNPGACTAFY